MSYLTHYFLDKDDPDSLLYLDLTGCTVLEHFNHAPDKDPLIENPEPEINIRRDRLTSLEE